MNRTLKTMFAAALIAAALATALTMPASAELANVTVRMPDGTIQAMVVDIPAGATLQDISTLVPGEPVGWEVIEQGEPEPQLAPEPGAPAAAEPPATDDVAPQTAPAPAPQPTAPAEATPAPPEEALTPGAAPLDEPMVTEEQPLGRERLEELESAGPRLTEPGRRGSRPGELRVDLPSLDEAKRQARHEGYSRPDRNDLATPRMRADDGSPTSANPGLTEALPGPAFTSGVPNFVIEKFRVPVFLLPIYQAAGIEYGVRWEILAAINEIETDYGRNLNVSSAGALGWMQFIPSSWRAYGVDANKDGRKDPYNPVDAIFAAARYLKAADYENDVRGAIFAYNHANWYVDSVLLRAKLIAGVPADLVGSLTGLTEGRFPVAAKARYADDLQEARTKRVQAGENAANVIESDANRRSIEIYAKKGSPAVATNDGRIKTINRNTGQIVLQDVYGNTYTYNDLGSLARYHPVPKDDVQRRPGLRASALRARDSEPAAPASAGSQPEARDHASRRATRRAAPRPRPRSSVKQRLFAHPNMPQVRGAGGMAQLLAMDALGEDAPATYRSRFAPPVRLDPDRFVARPLRRGSRVTAGTVLGRVGATVPGKGSHLEFSIRPAGKGAPTIDPKPILDGWKLLEATAIYRASGRNVLRGGGASVGQILLMPKPMLERRVLADERIQLYDGGRGDIQSGQIDRRVLATIAYLAESGMRPTITSLKSGHGFLTASGNVSHHSSGNAVDVAAINGVPVSGHQEPGGVTEQAVRRLMALQGTMRPDQIISLLDLGSNTVAMGDHADHIHVGFAPAFGSNVRLGRQAQAVLKPGQWPQLLQRLEDIDNPVVPTRPSPYAIPAG